MKDKSPSDRVDRSPEGRINQRYEIVREDRGVLAALDQYEKDLRATYKFSSKGKIELMKRKIATEIVSATEDIALRARVVEFGLGFYKKIEVLKQDMTRVRSTANRAKRRKLKPR